MKAQLLAAIVSLCLAVPLCGQDSIRLKARAMGGAPASWDQQPGARLPREAGHYIVQFQRLPSAEMRSELARRGARVLEAVPPNALMIALPDSFDGAGLGVSHWLHLSAADKLSPLLSAATGFYLVVLEPDADLDNARTLAESYGFEILTNTALLPGQLLIAGDSTRLAAFATWDEVSYILPASPDLVSGSPVMPCAGALSEAGTVGAYVLMSEGWPADANGVVSLNYAFGNLTSRFDPAVVQSTIVAALRAWEQAANLSLVPGGEAEAARTIYIEFVSGAHGDSYPFTSPASLAHTFYPNPPNPEPIAGDMHLNADESWNLGTMVDLFSVVLHEAGHALGLGHSDQPGAVMYPYYHLATGLSDDDIAGIQALYGPPASAPQPVPPVSDPPTPNPPPPTPPTPAPPVPTPPASGSGAAPALTIIAPAATMVETIAASLVFSGTASASAGVASVNWSDAYGDTGAATGTTSWTATVPLLQGTNVITVRVYDQAGRSAWRSVTVVKN